MFKKLSDTSQAKSSVIKRIILFFTFGLILYIIWPIFNYNINSFFFGFNSQYVNKDIVIVWLDDDTLNKMSMRYQEIWRSIYTDLLNKIIIQKPKAIAVDVVFKWSTLEDNDLFDLLNKNSNLIIWTEVISEIGQNWKPEISQLKEILWQTWLTSLWEVSTIQYNYLGLNNDSFLDNSIFSSKDLKNIIPVYGEDSYWKPFPLPLSIKTYFAANNIANYKVESDGIYFKDKKIPLDNWNFNVNFFIKDYIKDYEFISFKDALDNSYDFKDKIVFIWATASDIHDEFLTPLTPNSFTPWVVFHANAYNTISSWKFLYYNNIYTFLFINLLFLVLLYLVVEWSNSIKDWLIKSISIIVSFVVFSISLFILFWIYIEVTPFLICYILLSLVLYFEKYLNERKSKDEIKSMFSKYMSEDVINNLIANWIENLQLGWMQKEMTVFFSDLAWFTDLSENLEPVDLGKILNVYFSAMSDIILENKWTIDKFIWDAIMAFWNAPLDQIDHADLACITAIKQREVLSIVREELVKMGKNIFIDMRIWINTGKSVIWNFGSQKRYDYTALGDTVNLASRLEWINKQYDTNIIISEYTYNALKNKEKFLVRELDLITVKWKTKPVIIYELLGFADTNEKQKLELLRIALEAYKNKDYKVAIDAFKKIWSIPSENFIKKLKEYRNIDNYKKALEAYRNKDFETARNIFKEIWDLPSQKFADRCEEYMRIPPSKSWDWVYKYHEK